MEWIMLPPLEPVRNRSRLDEINAPPSTARNILELPTEIRLRIYHFCFPARNKKVQLIPYRLGKRRCHLNLPLNIYLVCRQFFHELPQLHLKLRSLDFIFVIRSDHVISRPTPNFSGNVENNDHGADDDAQLKHFAKIIRYAVRVRLICSGFEILTIGIPLTRSNLLSQTNLPRSALRILEIEIRPFCFTQPELNSVDVIKVPGLAKAIAHHIFWPLLGPYLERLDNLQIKLHGKDRHDTIFETIIQEQIMPYIPRGAIVGYLGEFRSECFAALLELLA